jgi:hypothetical protein
MLWAPRGLDDSCRRERSNRADAQPQGFVAGVSFDLAIELLLVIAVNLGHRKGSAGICISSQTCNTRLRHTTCMPVMCWVFACLPSICVAAPPAATAGPHGLLMYMPPLFRNACPAGELPASRRSTSQPSAAVLTWQHTSSSTTRSQSSRQQQHQATPAAHRMAR